MTVYVDNMRRRYRAMIMCHMVADTLPELLAMVDAIGVARKHLQQLRSRPHFDICLERRAAAIRLGAAEIVMRETPAIARRCAAATALPSQPARVARHPRERHDP
jgi:Protein of unknown function (DUF4031)